MPLLRLLLRLIKEPGIICIVVVIWPLLYLGQEEFHSGGDTAGSIAQKGHYRILVKNFAFGLKSNG